MPEVRQSIKQENLFYRSLITPPYQYGLIIEDNFYSCQGKLQKQFPHMKSMTTILMDGR
jgi:hypothetical protein